MKRMILVVLSFLLVTALVSVGGQKEAAAERPVTITWNDIYGESGLIVAKAQAKMFEAKYPSIKVVVNGFEHELSKTLIRTWMVSDDPPDVVSWQSGSERFGGFIKKGLVRDVSELWKKEGLFEKFTRAAMLKVTFDGRQYGISRRGNYNGIFYRKSVFAKYGLREPKTWDEFLTVCKKLKIAGVTPIAIGFRGTAWPAAFWSSYLNLRINGLDFEKDLAYGKASYTDPRFEKVFLTWKALVDQGYFLKEMGAYDWQEAAATLERGEAAMCLLGGFFISAISDKVKPDIDVFPFPVIDPSVKKYELYYGEVAMIPTKAKHPEEAELLIGFLSSLEAQKYEAEHLGELMEHKGISLEMYHPTVKKLADYYETIDGLTSFWDREVKAEMYDKGLELFQQFMLTPDKYKDIMAKLEGYRKQYYGD